jgi:hypothetical protein
MSDMTDDVEHIESKVDGLTEKVVLLNQQLEVHIAGEAGYRLLSLEKLETLRLTLETQLLKAFTEQSQRYDARLMILEAKAQAIENTAQAHIDACEKDNRKLDDARKIRVNQIYALWVGVLLCLVTVGLQFLFK